ncbi:Oidioi.mRNA.OKI2018_I69.chr1.g2201.t1.cds [Oikopleura dioica]|uniref:F-actin-capping protein subunit beta n=1 Tax=Oikopleura dioica TaxID=34765 RepID=A0ABN7SQE2_OIKDI|nr:Oidioi.mRNA.OKI2018_I69.chr1.g2201.t1.cds [Oikopleura dioica]
MSKNPRVRLESALDLHRRLPPDMVERNLSNMIDLAPDLTEDLLERVDQPLRLMRDEEVGRDFLLCDYNRDGDSYRSPWSDKYFPAIPDGLQISELLRKIEIEFNDVFNQYRELYYDGGISSVYLWEIAAESGFAGAILFKKAGDGSQNIPGSWDSIHIFEVIEKTDGFHYRLTTTVMLWLQTKSDSSGLLSLGGSLQRQTEKHVTGTKIPEHILEIGKMVEDIENKIRNSLNDVYFDKTRAIVSVLRTQTPINERIKNRQQLAAELTQRLDRLNSQPDG